MDRAGHLRHCTFVLMREDNRFPAFHVARHLRLHFRVGPHAVFGQHADMLAQPVRLDGDVALQRLGDLVHVQRGRFVVGQQLAREGEAEGLPAADPHRRQAEGLVGHPEAVPGLVVLQRRNPKKPVFDFRAHFCHSAPMETHAFGFRLRANAPEGQKRFPISWGAMPQPFLVHDVAVAGPATHALVIGVGDYPHLNGGSEKRTEQHDGMEQLTSPPISARLFASWLMSGSSVTRQSRWPVSRCCFRKPTRPVCRPHEPGQEI